MTEGTYQFVGKVITGLKELHKDVQPLKTFHFGGDEVASGAWDGLGACKSVVTSHGGKPYGIVFVMKAHLLCFIS